MSKRKYIYINFFAHKDGDRVEFLDKHSVLTLRYASRYLRSVRKIIVKIFGNTPEARFIYEAARDAIIHHDDGKKSPYVQHRVMQNPEFSSPEYGTRNSAHSVIGAAVYLGRWLKKLDEFQSGNRGSIERMIWYFAYIISRHHGQLYDFSHGKFMESLSRYLDGEGDYFICMDMNKEELREIIMRDSCPDCWGRTDMECETYILCRLLYSVLCYSDYCATTEFMTGRVVIDRHGFSGIRRQYKESGLYRNTLKQCGTEMNMVRNDIFRHAELGYESNPGSRIYYLSAPCGSGKTNTLFNISLRCADENNMNKCLFVFPLNTLVEQTGTVMDSFLTRGVDYMVKNSITSITDEKEEECDYELLWLKYQFLNYPVVITSHVALFNILFGIGKGDCMCLCQLHDSVIVLDEIQQYDARIWKETAQMLAVYADLLNIRVIISSATLPPIGKLFNGAETADLLDRDYSREAVFMNRVEYDYRLLESKTPDMDIIRLINEHIKDNILIEFITKKSAVEFYGKIKDSFPDVDLMTGDTPKKRKREIIRKSKTCHMILVGTQVFEAGIDIDFKTGFKEIGILESDFQFVGRIARNALFKGKVYFFSMTDVSYVYGDIRNSYTIMEEKYRRLFEDGNWETYYEIVFAEIERIKTRTNRNGMQYFNSLCGGLKFGRVAEYMKLIRSDDIRVFIIRDEEARILTEEFKDTVNARRNMSYAEKSVKYLALSEKMDEYMINMPKYRNKELRNTAVRLHGIYFVESDTLSGII